MDEKMKILIMLEDGKITPQQATALLSALGNTADNNSASRPSRPGTDETRYTNDGRYAPPEQKDKNLGLDALTSEMRERLSSLAKELEPKLKNFTAAMAEKTAEFAERVANSAADIKPAASATPARKDAERSFNIPVTITSGELSLHALNAPLIIRGYNGDKITAKVNFRTKFSEEDIKLVANGSQYSLQYDPAAFAYVSIDAYIPNLFHGASLKNTNAELRVSGLNLKNISIECNDGPIIINEISADSGRLENTNSPIQATNLDIQNLKLETSNAPVNLNIASFQRHTAYNWIIETSNARLFANLPTSPSLGYHFKASTALGSIRLGFAGLAYSLNIGTNVEAKTSNYDSCDKKVSLSLETSNADIVAN